MNRGTTPKILRCGVAGVGYLGQHHARLYSTLPQCALIGVYDPDTKRAAGIAKQWECQVFPSIETLGNACEAVSVVTPTDQHCAVALALLRLGCHLLIEKPLCTSLYEAGQIHAAAQATGKLVQVGHVEHFNPVTTFLEEHVSQPRYITAERLAPFNPRGTDVGVVLDLMIHDIGVILQLVPVPIQHIDVVGIRILSAAEDIANARITFANGCVANVNASRVSEKRVREIRIFQPRVYLSLDFMNQQGHLVRHNQGQLNQEEIPLEKEEPLELEIASFAQCVVDSELPKVDITLGRSALKVALQITEAIKQGQTSVEWP